HYTRKKRFFSSLFIIDKNHMSTIIASGQRFFPMATRRGFLSSSRAKNQAIADRLVKLDKKYVWHPFTQMQDWEKDPQIIIETAQGSTLTDVNGKTYLDGVSSLWVTVHGHRKKEMNKAVATQLDKIAHSTLLGLSNVPAVLLAEKLAKLAPKGLSKIFYSDSG